MNDERQFRLFSIAVLGLVAVVAMKAGAKRALPNFDDPSLSLAKPSQKMEIQPPTQELEALQEVERINSGEYSSLLAGQTKANH